MSNVVLHVANFAQGDWGKLDNTKLSNGYFDEMAVKADLVSCADSYCFGSKQPADLLEAVIGAVYLDSGRDMSAVRRAMIAVGFTEVLDESDNPNKQQTATKVEKIVAEDEVSNSDDAEMLALYDAVFVSRT